MVPWWFISIVLMCFARCAVTRHPSPAARSTYMCFDIYVLLIFVLFPVSMLKLGPLPK